MIKFSKNLLLNPAKIRVSGIKCSFNNIVKIANVFDCKWIVVTIDSITESSSLLTLMKDQGLKYFARLRSADYVEISVIIPYTLFEVFLEKAINEEPENIFVLNLLDSANSVMCLQRSYEELVATGITNVFISISFDENALLICVNKSLLSPQEVFEKIKVLRFS